MTQPAEADTRPSSGGRAGRGLVVVATVMLAAAVAQAFGRFTWGVVLPDARDDILGGSNTLAGLFGTVNVGAYLLGTLAAASMSARLSLVRMFRAGMILSTTGMSMIWLVPIPIVTAASLFVMGFGGALIWIPSPALAARELPPRRQGVAAGLVGSGIGIGIVFSGQLAAQLRDPDRLDTWRDVYAVQSVIAVAALIAAFAILSPKGQRPSTSGGLGGFGALRTIPGWKALTGAYTAYGFSYLMVIAFVVARLEDDSGLSAGRASAVFSVLGVAIIFGGPLIGFVADRVGVRPTLMFASSIFGLSTLLLLTGESPWIWVAAVGLGMMFAGIPSTIVAHIVQNADVDTYGPAFSAATLAFGVAQMAAPQVGGAIADAAGTFGPTFVISAACSFAGVAIASRLPRR